MGIENLLNNNETDGMDFLPPNAGDMLSGTLPFSGSILAPEPKLEPAPQSLAGSIWDTVWGGAQSALTALDTLGRPIRTTLATGDLGRAFESIYNPDVASSARDVLETFGAPRFGNDDGTFELGDVADFVLDLGVGIATDPLSFVSLGATGSARAVARASAKAANVVRKTGNFADAASILRKAGATIAKGEKEREAVTGFLKTGGKTGTLAERLKKGDAGMGFDIPLTNVRLAEVKLPFLAPVVESMKDVGTIARAAADTVSGGIVGRTLGFLKNSFSESSGVRGVDVIGQLSNDAAVAMREFAERVADPMRDIASLGLGDDGSRMVMEGVERTMNPEQVAAIAKTTGMGEAEILEYFKARRGDNSIESIIKDIQKRTGRVMTDAEYDATARTIQGAVTKVHSVFQDMLKAEGAAGVTIANLGDGTRAVLRDRAKELRVAAIQAGIPAEALAPAADGTVRNIRNVVEDFLKGPADDVSKNLLTTAARQYDEALDIAITVPGYVPLYATPEAAAELIKIERNNPGMMRRMADHKGVYHTVAEANEAVKAIGTAATAGQAIKGPLSFRTLWEVYKGGEGLSGKAKAIKEAASKNGKMFEDELVAAMAQRLQYHARVVGAAERGVGIKNTFGEALPEELAGLYKEKKVLEDWVKLTGREVKKNKKMLRGLKIAGIGDIEDRVVDLINRIGIVEGQMPDVAARVERAVLEASIAGTTAKQLSSQARGPGALVTPAVMAAKNAITGVKAAGRELADAAWQELENSKAVREAVATIVKNAKRAGYGEEAGVKLAKAEVATAKDLVSEAYANTKQRFVDMFQDLIAAGKEDVGKAWQKFEGSKAVREVIDTITRNARRAGYGEEEAVRQAKAALAGAKRQVIEGRAALGQKFVDEPFLGEGQLSARTAAQQKAAAQETLNTARARYDDALENLKKARGGEGARAQALRDSAGAEVDAARVAYREAKSALKALKEDVKLEANALRDKAKADLKQAIEWRDEALKKLNEAKAEAGKYAEGLAGKAEAGVALARKRLTDAKTQAQREYDGAVRAAANAEARARDAADAAVRAAKEELGTKKDVLSSLGELAGAQKATVRRLTKEQLQGSKEYEALVNRARTIEITQRLHDIERDIEGFGRNIDNPVMQGKVLASKIGLAKEGADDFVLPSDVAKAKLRQDELMRQPNYLGQISQAAGRFNSFWKKMQLAFPATVARNFIGQVSQIAQGGGLTPHLASDMWQVAKMQFALRGRKTLEESRKYLETIQVNLPNGMSKNGAELIDEAHKLGVIDSGFFGNELWDLSSQLKGRHKALFIGPHMDKPVLDYALAANKFVENNGKLAMWLGRIRQGDSLEDAALIAGQNMFNYRNVSPAINAMRSSGLAPFASWSGKNIPRQIWLATHRPGQYVAMMHAKQALEEGIPGMTEEQAKAYVHDKLGIRVRDKDGELQFISLDGVLPASDLISFRQAFAGIDEFSEWATNQVGGPIKAAVETLFNRDLLTKQEIKRFDGQGQAFQIPWVKDAPSFAVWDPRITNIAKKVAGRPVTTLEGLARYANEEIDKDTGKPYALSTAVGSAVMPFMARNVFSPHDQEVKIMAVKRELSAAKAVIEKNKGKNSWEVRMAMRSVEDAERRLRELQTPPGGKKKASALPFIP